MQSKNYIPHKYQLDFHRSNAQYRTMIAGRRSGKTLAGTMEALYWADTMATKLGEPTRGIIVAPTYQDAKDVNVKILFEWLPEKSIKDWNKTEMTLKLINGSEILFRYADPKKIGRGNRFHWAWLDEACFYEQGKMVWETLIPSLTDYNGYVWVTTTPQGKDWVYKTFYEPALKGNELYEAWNFKSIENPYLPREYIEQAEKSMSEIMFRQEYLASFESFSGLIYPDWNEETMVISEFIKTDDLVYFLGIDVGWKHPTGILLAAENKEHEIIFIDEHQASYMTPKMIEDAVDQMLIRNGLTRKNIYMYIIDPASKGTDQTSGVSVYDQLQDYTILREPFQLFPAVNDVMAGINRVTELLRGGKIKVLDRCIQLRAQMAEYRWATKRDESKDFKPEVYKLNDDLVDPLRYIVMSRPDWFNREKIVNGVIIEEGKVIADPENDDGDFLVEDERNTWSDLL